jgi:hypothetical protein
MPLFDLLFGLIIAEVTFPVRAILSLIYRIGTLFGLA